MDPRNSALRSNFRPSAVLFPFTSRWFAGSAGRMHYVDEGRGRPILLLHGNPTWSYLYRKMIPRLTAAGFRCIAPDLLGYGLSDHPTGFGYRAHEQAEAIGEFILALNLTDLIIVGQDWGGPIGLAAVVPLRDRVCGVVLGSTFAWRVSGFVRVIAWILRSRWIQRRIVHSEHFVERVVRALARANLSNEDIQHYCAVVESPVLREAHAVLPRELIDADRWLAELAHNVATDLGRTPALLFHARSEGPLGRASVRRFARMFRDHAIVVLPRTGHFFQEDAPEAVVAAICARFGTTHTD